MKPILQLFACAVLLAATLVGFFTLSATESEARVIVGGGVIVGAPVYAYPPYYGYAYPYAYPASPYPYQYSPPPPSYPSYAQVPPPNPADHYYQDRGGQYCREYSHMVLIEGHQQEIYGHACRQPDGSWQIVD